MLLSSNGNKKRAKLIRGDIDEFGEKFVYVERYLAIIKALATFHNSADFTIPNSIKQMQRQSDSHLTRLFYDLLNYFQKT